MKFNILRFNIFRNKSKFDIQAPNGNSHSVELQDTSSINNNTTAKDI
ncbi:MAG: hypothetical protein LBH67_00980 [Rickettsia sp.]|jgi:hypothetical protein|nr:hypothetical protein [Rickettsia sp.]